MNYIYVTNNPLIKEKINSNNIIFIEGSVLDVYKRARKLITQKNILVSHPLTGNIPPHIIPFKTVILKKGNKISKYDLQIMDKTIRYLNRLSEDNVQSKWNNEELEDYKILDLDYVISVLKNQKKVTKL